MAVWPIYGFFSTHEPQYLKLTHIGITRYPTYYDRSFGVGLRRRHGRGLGTLSYKQHMSLNKHTACAPQFSRRLLVQVLIILAVS